MNKIYWDKDKISIVTDQMEAVEHRHWAMQLFLGLEEALDICVSGKSLICECILVNQNVNHSFSTAHRLHISMIIEPASDIAMQLSRIIGEKEYHIFDAGNSSEIKKLGYMLLHRNDKEDYKNFTKALYSYLGVIVADRAYDSRIREVLYHIENCGCNEHSISSLADKVSLSPSRLSHLFKEQVGIPLKSYIQMHQMHKAFLALLSGKSITEAAMIANFDTPSHFAAVTKRMMGTPASISLKNSEFLKVFDV